MYTRDANTEPKEGKINIIMQNYDTESYRMKRYRKDKSYLWFIRFLKIDTRL